MRFLVCVFRWWGGWFLWIFGCFEFGFGFYMGFFGIVGDGFFVSG